MAGKRPFRQRSAVVNTGSYTVNPLSSYTGNRREVSTLFYSTILSFDVPLAAGIACYYIKWLDRH